jgi:hypothetical protein
VCSLSTEVGNDVTIVNRENSFFELDSGINKLWSLSIGVLSTTGPKIIKLNFGDQSQISII